MGCRMQSNFFVINAVCDITRQLLQIITHAEKYFATISIFLMACEQNNNNNRGSD
jgi:hypothetical protein